MKLNLGCGNKPLVEYVNIDSRELPGVDRVLDLRGVLPYEDGTVHEIYAKHIIEHFTPQQWGPILTDWVRILAPGGTLIIECPDMAKACEGFIYDRFGLRWTVWHRIIYGESEEGMAHRQGFTIGRLKDDLEHVGLVVTRARNWHDDHPDHINDRTWHYNIRMEARKP